MRNQRVAEEIRDVLAQLMREGLKDPRVGFATIVTVELSGDLSVAKVYISVLGDQEAKLNTMKGLQSAAGFLRSEVGKRLRLRHAPELRFELDESMEHGARIASLLHQIKKEEAGGTRDSD